MKTKPTYRGKKENNFLHAKFFECTLLSFNCVSLSVSLAFSLRLIICSQKQMCSVIDIFVAILIFRFLEQRVCKSRILSYYFLLCALYVQVRGRLKKRLFHLRILISALQFLYFFCCCLRLSFFCRQLLSLLKIKTFESN